MAKRTTVPKRDIRRHQLSNGVRVLSERVKGSPAVAVGVWVDAGSRYEELKESGMTYLIQRLSFYGTKNRSAEKIANTIDSLGGEVSTKTNRDYALYSARVQKKDLAAAVDLLADMALRPRLGETGFATEQKKLLEELRAAEKDADSVLEQMFLRSLWKGHGLCRPPQGRLLTYKGTTKVESFKLKALRSFHQRSHHPKGLTITAGGALDHDKFAAMVEKHFGSLGDPKKTVSTKTPAVHQFLALRNRPAFSSVRVQLGSSACSAAEKERHAAHILNTIIARGAGSRLGRLVREDKLHAAEVVSSLLMFKDAGCLSVRIRSSRSHIKEDLVRIGKELYNLAATPVDAAELKRAKATRRAALLAEIDSLPDRIENLARQERYFHDVVSMEEDLAEIEDVTANQMRTLASEWFTPYNLSLAVLGNLKGVRISRQDLRPF